MAPAPPPPFQPETCPAAFSILSGEDHPDAARGEVVIRSRSAGGRARLGSNSHQRTYRFYPLLHLIHRQHLVLFPLSRNGTREDRQGGSTVSSTRGACGGLSSRRAGAGATNNSAGAEEVYAAFKHAIAAATELLQTAECGHPAARRQPDGQTAWLFAHFCAGLRGERRWAGRGGAGVRETAWTTSAVKKTKRSRTRAETRRASRRRLERTPCGRTHHTHLAEVDVAVVVVVHVLETRQVEVRQPWVRPLVLVHVLVELSVAAACRASAPPAAPMMFVWVLRWAARARAWVGRKKGDQVHELKRN